MKIKRKSGRFFAPKNMDIVFVCDSEAAKDSRTGCSIVFEPTLKELECSKENFPWLFPKEVYLEVKAYIEKLKEKEA